VHDPAKALRDLAVTLALGGDCLADVGKTSLLLAATLRCCAASQACMGWWRRTPTVSRTIPATIARTGRRVRLNLAAKAPWPTCSTTQSNDSEPSPQHQGKTHPTVRQPPYDPRPAGTGAHPETTLGLGFPQERRPAWLTSKHARR